MIFDPITSGALAFLAVLILMALNISSTKNLSILNCGETNFIEGKIDFFSIFSVDWILL